MSQILFSLSIWLHALATVIFIGHYLLLTLIYLPSTRKHKPEIVGPILSEVSKRSRVWMYTSLLTFIVTGIYLMIVDPNYLGIGDFLGMIGMGFWFNAILRVGPMMSSNNSAEQAIARFRSYSSLMAVSGVIVLLLTAFAQIE
jgi:uncharacterized membrane protein